MHLQRNVSLCLFFALVCTMSAGAQQGSSQPPAPGSAASGGIQLDVVVAPKSGVPVAGLKQSDFTLLDNGTPRTITSFRAESGVQEPVQVLLLIDDVNPTFTTVAYERGQIGAFLQANGGHLSQPTSITLLTEKGVQIQKGVSKDGKALAALLDRQTIGLRQITRSTGFYGAGERMDISLKALLQLASYETSQPGRKMVIWLSPGWPLLEGTEGTLQNEDEKRIFREIVTISTLLRQSHTTLYNLNSLGVDENLVHAFAYEEFLKGVAKPGDAEYGDLALQVIASQSGGLVLNSSDVAGMLRRCVADTTDYYRLTFDPPPGERDTVYHRLEIKLDEPGLTARTNSGYYVQP